MDLQSSAPMAKAATATPNTKQGTAAATGATTPPITPLSAPTDRPDEPVTEGNPMGPGAGPGVLSAPVQASSDPQAVFKADASALRPFLPGLLRAASTPDAPEGFRRFVRTLRTMQGA